MGNIELFNETRTKKNTELKQDIRIVNAFNAAVKSSGYHFERLKQDRTLETKPYRHIFYYYCRENKLCSSAVASSFFDQDHATCYNGWQNVKKMIETKDNFYLAALNRFNRQLSMIENDFEKLIESMKFDAFNMSDSAFYEKYLNLLF